MTLGQDMNEGLGLNVALDIAPQGCPSFLRVQMLRACADAMLRTRIHPLCTQAPYNTGSWFCFDQEGELRVGYKSLSWCKTPWVMIGSKLPTLCMGSVASCTARIIYWLADFDSILP
jgi:hypothetical protein